MNELIKTSDFDPLVGWIREMRPEDRFIKIDLPSHFVIDADSVTLFLDNASIEFIRHKDYVQRYVTGFVRDPTLYAYLTEKRKTSGYMFEFHFSHNFGEALSAFNKNTPTRQEPDAKPDQSQRASAKGAGFDSL